MRYYESLAEYIRATDDQSLFLAGGITGTQDWRKEIRERLSVTDLVLLNPFQQNFPIDDPSAAQVQIEWEYRHLRLASAILFWFPCETLCPIALYELGAWAMTKKPICVGVHPDYKRRQDVEIQMALARPDVRVVYSLEALALEAALTANRGMVCDE